MVEDQFLTPDELVSRYNRNISVKTLANWRTKGGGPEYIKIGGKIMYSKSSVVLWERLRTYGSTAVRVAHDARKAVGSIMPLIFMLTF